MGKKINCLEGVRAISCICVFLSHFWRALLPASSLNILSAGNTAVRILFILSGFVVSYKYMMKKNYELVPQDIFKRYFRLMPPILCVNLLVCFFMKQGMLFNVEASRLSGSEDFLGLFNIFSPDLWLCVKEGIATCFLHGANAYVGPLWTITYEFWGTVLILCVIAVSKDGHLRYLFYIIELSFFSSYYNYFVIGMLICDLYHNTGIREILVKNKIINNILFLCSVVVVIMLPLDDGIKFTRILFGIASTGMFLTLLCGTWGEKYLGNTVMCYIGKISFSIYLLHWPIIESLSSWIYIYLADSGIGNVLALSINILLTGAMVFFGAYLLNKYIEPIGQCAVKYIERQDFI